MTRRIGLLTLLLALGAPCHGRSGVPEPHEDSTTVDLFPILSYDTDAGYGFGGKAFLLNGLEWRESFDLTLFMSTKGERWYRLVFSVPDFEVRQGTVYALALDISVDFDKWIGYKFFGVGADSPFEDAVRYTREPLDITATVSKGLSYGFVGQAGLRFRSLTNTDVPPGSSLDGRAPDQNAATATSLGLLLGLRYDTRNSYIAPSTGSVVQVDFEFSPRMAGTNTEYFRGAIWLQQYTEIGVIGSVLALRAGLEGIEGSALPIQVLVAIGGNRTVRGSVQDRFLDRVGAVCNAELRIPLLWRFGMVAGFDGGRVWPSPATMSLSGWTTNPVVGLRFLMDTFVVRADLGFGAETTGFYLNFGHLF